VFGFRCFTFKYVIPCSQVLSALDHWVSLHSFVIYKRCLIKSRSVSIVYKLLLFSISMQSTNWLMQQAGISPRLGQIRDLALGILTRPSGAHIKDLASKEEGVLGVGACCYLSICVLLYRLCWDLHRLTMITEYLFWIIYIMYNMLCFCFNIDVCQ